MKHRFEYKKNPSSYRGTFFSIILFALCLGLFLTGVSTISHKTDSEAVTTLTQAVNRGITRCYALEGAYPENLDYLRKNYGLMYDEERFYIDYHSLGSNIMPDVTIIDRRKQR